MVVWIASSSWVRGVCRGMLCVEGGDVVWWVSVREAGRFVAKLSLARMLESAPVPISR